MAKREQRISIYKRGLIMEVPEDRRSKFILAAIVEVFADQELYDRVMKRVTGLTVQAFLRPGQIIVDSATMQPVMQPVEQKPPKAAPREPVKPAPVSVPAATPAPKQKPTARTAAEQKPAAQPASQPEAGAEEAEGAAVPGPAAGKPIVRVNFDFIEEGG